jgi:hypothetical protein
VPPRQAAQSSGRQSSRTSADFALSGPSDLPDPRRFAYRKDLADIALAGRVIASHYSEPLKKQIGAATALHAGPNAESEVLAELKAGEEFDMLDNSLGWAWGYAGSDRIVGYVRSETLES